MSTFRSSLWQEVADFTEVRLNGTWGSPVGVTGPALHPTRDCVAAAAEVRDALTAPARSVITLFEGGTATPLREGWSPAWSPDGGTLAHLDSRGVQVGELHRALAGSIERLRWKPDGTALLVVVADPRSEVSGVNASGIVPVDGDEAWTPVVESTLGHTSWRRLHVLDVATGSLIQVGRPDLNVWNACWAGEELLAVCSDGSPTESAWYTADLRLLDPRTGTDRVVARPATQIGPIAASPSGDRIAYVTSICSDRDLVAGDLQLHDLRTGEVRRLAAPTDVSDLAFVSEDQLGFAGLVGLTTRVGLVSADDEVTVLWEGLDVTASGVDPTAGFRAGAAAFCRVGHDVRPEVVLVTDAGEPVVLAALLPDAATEATGLPGTAQVHRWTAPDGLEIEGWLYLPDRRGPHPLVVLLHGGPVHSTRAGWSALGGLRPLLLQRGYAVLCPNPRGSSGRGQEFASAVVGDMGGADALDITSAVTSLVEAGVADPDRIGVTGGSYGGYLTSWLVTQTDQFAAAVAQFPITDWTFQHGASCIPFWDELFLDGKPYARDGQYVERSPLAHVAQVTTPTLFLAGALDRATPAGQALAMHRALAAHGVPSECVTYPSVAHGPREVAPLLDTFARIVGWFERWMPATPTGAGT